MQNYFAHKLAPTKKTARNGTAFAEPDDSQFRYASFVTLRLQRREEFPHALQAAIQFSLRRGV